MPDVLAKNLILTGRLFLFSTFPLLSGCKKVRFIFKVSFINISRLTPMYVGLLLQTEEAPFAALRITFYVTHGRLLQRHFAVFRIQPGSSRFVR